MFLETLRAEYGDTFLITLAVSYFGFRGITGAGALALALPYYQELLEANITTYHRTILCITFVWAAKPLFGMISDHFPIGGYRKRYYVVFFGLLAGWASIMLAVVKPSIDSFWYFFCIVVGLVFTDLLFEAKYSELMNASKSNVSGANIISYAWGLGAVGAALGALWGSQMATVGYVQNAFILLAVAPVLLALRTYQDGMQEARNAPPAPASPPLLIIALWLVATTVLSAVAVTTLTPVSAVIIQLCCAASLVYASLRWIPMLAGTQTTMAQCNVFLFLAEITAIRLTGATDYFFTADCPSGSGEGELLPTPRFEYDFYLGWMPIVGSIASMLGVIIFTKYLQHMPLRYVFQGIAVVRIVLSGVEVWQASRRNLGYVDDKLLFFLSEGVMSPVVSMAYLLPLVAVTSRLMPKGNEALTYGILAGYQNFGQSIANTLGLMLIEKSQVGQGCSFGDYPFMVFVAHIIAPLATIPLACFLVPTISVAKSETSRTPFKEPATESILHARDESREAASTDEIIPAPLRVASSPLEE